MVDRFPVSTIRTRVHSPIVECPKTTLPEEVSVAATPQSASRHGQPDTTLSDKMLDAKVRLHQRLLEETNLSALEKLSEEEIRQHISEVAAQYIRTSNLALNSQEF